MGIIQKFLIFQKIPNLVNLKSHIKRGAKLALGLLLLNSCSPTSVIQNSTSSYTEKEIGEVSELCPEYNINLDQIENHIISAEVSRVNNLSSLELLVSDNQGQEFYSHLIQNPKIKNNSFLIRTSPILFLPDTTNIQLFGENNILADTTWTHDITKTIIIDRNGIDEKLYMIEGDENFMFGRLENVFNVSTGLYLNRYRNTPLGYWHVRSKSEYYVNQRQDWVMPWALWYFDKENEIHPANGIHEGFEGTPYGIPVSHGCTRVPEEHAENLWYWAIINTPIIYIDSTYYQTCYLDIMYFNINEYTPYKIILNRLLENQTNFPNNNYLIITKSNLLTSINEVSNIINQSCNTWTKPDSSFTELLERVANLYLITQ